jgi:hypothetical protein
MNNLVNKKNINIHSHNKPFLSPALLIKNTKGKPYLIYDPLAAHNLDYLRRILDTTAHGLVPFVNYLTSKYPKDFDIICKKNPFTLDKKNCIKSINDVVDIYLLLKIVRDFFNLKKNLPYKKDIVKNINVLFKTRNKFSHSEHLKIDKDMIDNPNKVHELRSSQEILKYAQSSVDLLELILNYELYKKYIKVINSSLITLQSTLNIINDSIIIRKNREELNNKKNLNLIKEADKTLDLLKNKLNYGTKEEKENVARSILNLINARLS